MIACGLALGLLLLALIFREQSLRFLLEPARLVELRLDPIAALIDAFHQHLVDAEIAEHADEEHEGDGDPEFGFEHAVSSALEHVVDGLRDLLARRASCR